MGNSRIITTIKPRRKYLDVFLDGEFALSLSPKVVAEAGVFPGQVLSEEELRELLLKELIQRALERAMRLLSYRPRSEGELRTRLRRQGFEEEVISYVVEKLRELRLLDDLAFARSWRESRQVSRPRSKRLLESELRKKGLAPEIIAEVVAEVDDESEAYRAALKKAHQLTGENYPVFRRKLAAYLSRRGFDWEVINSITQRLWREKS